MANLIDIRQTIRGGLNRLFGSRLFRGVGANAYGQAATLIIQFGSVPLLLSAWGVPLFGLWLIISAIPSYLALADFGFSTAAANDMTMATARGAYAEARGTFQSVLQLNVLVSLGLVAMTLLVVLLIPNRLLPGTSLVTGAEIRLVLILQTIQVAAALCCGVFGGGFQSSNRYALGVVLSHSARLMESIALVAGALLCHRFAPAAALMLTARLLALTAMAIVLMRVAPWLRLGFRDARLMDIRRLVSPAIAVTAVPSAFAVNLQGFVLVIGATLSLDAVAVFSTVRTLTRAVIQAGNVVNAAVMPEVTRAFGARDLPLLYRLIRLNVTSVIGLNVAAFAMVAMFGSWIVIWWTAGHIVPEQVLVIGLAVVAALHGLWLSQANLVLAVNRHAGYSYWFLVVCIASVVAAIPAVQTLGINGVLMPLIVGECVMILIVARVFRQTFGGGGYVKAHVATDSSA